MQEYQNLEKELNENTQIFNANSDAIEIARLDQQMLIHEIKSQQSL